MERANRARVERKVLMTKINACAALVFLAMHGRHIGVVCENVFLFPQRNKKDSKGS